MSKTIRQWLAGVNSNSEAKALRAANRASSLWHVAGGFVPSVQVALALRKVKA